MRRERSLASSLAVKSSKHFPAFEALVGDSAFHEKMTVAVRNPQGSTASKEFLHINKKWGNECFIRGKRLANEKRLLSVMLL
jgi:hypothetical protein